MSDKKFCDMTADEKMIDLEERVNKFSMLQLPGQPMGMHMGTSYLINDLWRVLKALASEEERVMGEPFHEANERLRERKRIENDKDAEIEHLTAENASIKGAFKDRCRVIEMQLEDKRKLQARVEQLEGVYDAVQNLSYADAVSGAEQWVDLREAMAAATEHGYGAWTCDCGKVNPETMHGCLACGFPDAATEQEKSDAKS